MSVCQDIAETIDGDLYDLINDLWVLIGEPCEGGGGEVAVPQEQNAAEEGTVQAFGAETPVVDESESTNPFNIDIQNETTGNTSQLQVNLPDYEASNSLPSWSDANSGEDSNPSILVQIIERISPGDDNEGSQNASDV